MFTVASVILCFSIRDTADEIAYPSVEEENDASSSVVVNNFSSAKEQSKGNEAQPRCLTTHGRMPHSHAS